MTQATGYNIDSHRLAIATGHRPQATGWPCHRPGQATGHMPQARRHVRLEARG
jgi:hypothetical protein